MRVHPSDDHRARLLAPARDVAARSAGIVALIVAPHRGRHRRGARLDLVGGSGIVITLGAAAVLVVTAIVFAIPRQTRPAGLIVGAAALGLVLGQNSRALPLAASRSSTAPSSSP